MKDFMEDLVTEVSSWSRSNASYLLPALDFSGVKKSTTNSFSKYMGMLMKSLDVMEKGERDSKLSRGL